MFFCLFYRIAYR